MKASALKAKENLEGLGEAKDRQLAIDKALADQNFGTGGVYHQDNSLLTPQMQTN